MKRIEPTDAAIKAFNQLAEKNPLKLRLRKFGNDLLPMFDCKNSRQIGLTFLWEYFFRGETWRRLKQCPVCGKWFCG